MVRVDPCHGNLVIWNDEKLLKKSLGATQQEWNTHKRLLYFEGTDLAFDPTPPSHSTLLHKNQKPRHIRPYPTKNKQPFQGKNNIARVTFDPTSFQVS